MKIFVWKADCNKKNHLTDLAVDGRTRQKPIVRKYGLNVWTFLHPGNQWLLNKMRNLLISWAITNLSEKLTIRGVLAKSRPLIHRNRGKYILFLNIWVRLWNVTSSLGMLVSATQNSEICLVISQHNRALYVHKYISFKTNLQTYVQTFLYDNEAYELKLNWN
jgi:hypothetical protein